MSKKGKPDSVSHKNYSVAFLPNIGPQIHETTVKKGKSTFTGVGWDRKEANKKAGDNYRKGKRD